MRVLGIDPGTALTGFGVVEPASGRLGRLVECGVIRTRAADPLPDRLHLLYDGVRELLDRHRPGALAVEGVFYATNVRTTVVLGHARGVILLAGAVAGVPVFEYSPAAVKKAIVGRGAATKPQVGFMIARLLNLAAAPAPADAADGVAIALTHLLSAPAGRRRGPGR